jgi:hypothetical protein
MTKRKYFYKKCKRSKCKDKCSKHKHSKHKYSKRKHTSKKRGGAGCYGNGIGANTYDPNFSIHNTRELQLFPYKP